MALTSTPAPVNSYGKVTGHEATANGTIAYVTDPTTQTTARIRLEKDGALWIISGDTVNRRGSKFHAFSTQSTLNEEKAREIARAYWCAANVAVWRDA